MNDEGPYGRDRIPEPKKMTREPMRRMTGTELVVLCCALWIGAGYFVDAGRWGIAAALAAVGFIALVAGSDRK